VDNKSAREWQEIASELNDEFNPKRVNELSAELTEALDRELKELQDKKEARVPPNL
jgi:hypothetical protein